jgi:hypothetical protein
MFKKFAGALLAATLLTAPALAEGMSKSPAPASIATQPVKANVKADATVKTFKGKHARKHLRSHFAKHNKGVTIVKVTTSQKQVKHIKVSKRFHGRNGVQASTKSLSKTGTN